MQFIVVRPDWQSWWCILILHLSDLIVRGMEAKTQEWNVSSYENVGLMPRLLLCLIIWHQCLLLLLLLLFFLLFVFLLGLLFSCSLLLTLGCLWIAGLFAWSDS